MPLIPMQKYYKPEKKCFCYPSLSLSPLSLVKKTTPAIFLLRLKLFGNIATMMLITSVASFSFFTTPSSSLPNSSSSMATSKALSSSPQNLNAREKTAAKATHPSLRALQVEQNIVNVNPTDATSEDNTQSIKQLQDSVYLLAAFSAIFIAAEKKISKGPDHLAGLPIELGRVLDDNIFRQCFLIRSYEVLPTERVSIDTLMNYLQDAAINHAKVTGVIGRGFGSTKEMNKKNLLWVFTKTHVEVESYPSWGETLEVITWTNNIERKGLRRDWHVKNLQTGLTVMKATCIMILMHKHTRKFCKIPDELIEETKHVYSKRPAIFSMETKTVINKFDEKRADCVIVGITPHQSDLDLNMHVNNVKYIGWVLESTPASILKSHQLSSMTLEFRRECLWDSVVQSLTIVSHNYKNSSSESKYIECQHLLKLESGAPVTKGLTRWRPKDRPHDGDPIPILDSKLDFL